MTAAAPLGPAGQRRRNRSKEKKIKSEEKKEHLEEGCEREKYADGVPEGEGRVDNMIRKNE